MCRPAVVVRNIPVPKEHEIQSSELYDLVNAIQDKEFMASFKKLTEDEVEDVFSMFLRSDFNYFSVSII